MNFLSNKLILSKKKIPRKFFTIIPNFRIINTIFNRRMKIKIMSLISSNDSKFVLAKYRDRSGRSDGIASKIIEFGSLEENGSVVEFHASNGPWCIFR